MTARLGRSAAASAIAMLLLSGAAHAQRSCDLGAPADGAPEAFSQFAFIIGDFRIDFRRMTEDGWSESLGTARWNGRYTLDGRAIMDWWYENGESGAAGVNLRMYDPQEEVWKTAWHYTGNFEVRELRQKILDDGKLHLWQVYPEAPERNVYFETYEDGRWARIDQLKDPETGAWRPAVKYDATPVACAPRN